MLGTDTQSAPKQCLPHGLCSGMLLALETMRKARGVREKARTDKERVGGRT